ncbi:Constitutive coactivator of peroxisome proliferator-activated receptor gamma [Bienertia sinuspersici]
MADRLLDENARDGNIELLYVNRAALSSAFERTLNRLYNALNNVAQKLPLGTYITAYMKGGISAVFPALQASMWELQKRRSLLSDDGDEFAGSDDQSAEVVGAEKLAQELLWIIHKLRACHGVDEALVQWSLASNLSSLALNANPRVQALLMKISGNHLMFSFLPSLLLLLQITKTTTANIITDTCQLFTFQNFILPFSLIFFFIFWLFK